MLYPVLILITVGLNTSAQLLLKLGSGQGLINLHLLGGVTCYGLSTVCYVVLLGKLNVTFAYPLLIGLSVIATTFAGAMYFHEKVPFLSMVGIGLMLSGICAIAFGKSLS
ncbi:MAG: small multidrug resistance protein [Leptolyngbya sp. Prado105]|jgi:multidrug transporter EmrE-like cation transporter|nr:small multidrug resistance protein [Leptolyngbya sp. Prado105]